ncbi:MAG: PASTA domain-containing protein [Clostridia bacterium]|nr:PASTA domain-containing protein [Clostridia bacterium]
MKSSTIDTKMRTGRRAVTVLVAFCVFAAFLIVNIFSLAVLKYDYYRARANEQLTTASKMRAERGSIYDANMNLLASTKTSWRVFVSTREIKSYTKKDGRPYNEIIARGLSDIFSLDYGTLLKKISNSSQLDVTVKASATEEEYRRVLEFIERSSLESLVFTEAQASRVYPAATLAAHVLGFTGSDNQGLFGLEYYYDKTLAGKDGYYLYAKDANGNAMPGEYTTQIPAEDGYSLVTTLDSYIQSELEGQLEQIRVNHTVTNRVTGIVMDTRTGAILAMATSSPFDPNDPFTLDPVSAELLAGSGFSEGSEEYSALKSELMQKMWSNKAICEAYEPGSTFKIVTVSTALDTGVADMSDTFSCPGYHMVGGWRIKCHKTTGHGSGFSLAYGLQMSCNPTMMCLAERIGSEKFYEYVGRFGYFEKSGIDLPGEATTIFHEEENIGSTELATASFGQRFKVSVISQLTAVAAVANGGVLVTPYLVQRVIDKDGRVISEHEVAERRQVISPEVAKEVARVLEEGVSGDGGAKNAYVDGYKVAAKTGTSQKFDILDENGNSYLRIGSTVAFAPSDLGGVAVIIVVDEPQSQVKYGSTVAAPYVSALLTKILPYMEYASSKESDVVSVGDYVGMNVKSAKDTLEGSGISYKIIGDGEVVLSQSPSPSIDISRSASVVILYTTEDGGDSVTVPNLLGMTLSEANRAAATAGLNLCILGISNREGDNIRVTEQSLPPGYVAVRGEVIKIRILGLDFED